LDDLVARVVRSEPQERIALFLGDDLRDITLQPFFIVVSEFLFLGSLGNGRAKTK
jgi:hypothetical protein